MQQCLRHGPAALHRYGRYTLRLAGFRNAHPAEKTAFNNATLPLIVLFQPTHRFVECDQRLGTRIRGTSAAPERLFHLVPRNTLLIAASFLALSLSRVIEHDV